MNYLRKEYNKLICDRISVIYDDLSDTELLIMAESFDIIESKVKEMKELNDMIYRLNIEIRNLKSFQDDKEYWRRHWKH